MSKFLIEGPCSLRGEITVSGSKNAALPIIAATLLADGKFVISNVPMISDIDQMLAILSDLGASVKFANHVCEIDTTGVSSYIPNRKLVKNIRASILFLGPLLARLGRVKIAHPGGCFIGARPVGTHFDAFEALGATILDNKNTYSLRAERLTGTRLSLDEISVTATENVVMAAVLAEGTTEIRLAATEPHVVDLCNFLVAMGANIEGIGTHTLTVKGVKILHPAKYTVIYDQIEAGTLAIAAAASRGELTIKGFVSDHQDILLKLFDQANVNYEVISKDTIKMLQSTSFNAIDKIRTDIYPNFASDMQAPLGVLMTQAEGTSTIFETMFEGRLNYLNELNKMGADCVIKNSHEASITGPTPLYGTTIETPDLRAGATLLIASFIAQGESIIERAEIIDRGYEHIDKRLSDVGAKIKRLTD